MSQMPKTHFTNHGVFRVEGGVGERKLQLSVEQIAEILDSDKAVPVGKDGDKVHRAFYSERDNMCFVAVQDIKNGDVITILPLSYHYRWVLDMNQVQKMAKNSFYHGSSLSETKSLMTAGPNTFCMISVEIWYQNDQKIRTERLRRFSVTEGTTLDEIVKNQNIRKEIEKEITWKTGRPILGFKVYFEENGNTSEFKWFEKDWSPRRDE